MITEEKRKENKELVDNLFKSELMWDNTDAQSSWVFNRKRVISDDVVVVTQKCDSGQDFTIYYRFDKDTTMCHKVRESKSYRFEKEYILDLLNGDIVPEKLEKEVEED